MSNNQKIPDQIISQDILLATDKITIKGQVMEQADGWVLIQGHVTTVPGESGSFWIPVSDIQRIVV